MKRQPAYNTLWDIEFQKFVGTLKKEWTLILVPLIFAALPWLTLRNFEEQFAFFSWHFLDESVLNFVIYSTANKLIWIMIITLPWIYHLIFAEESNRFFRKKNKLFTQLIAWKSMIYTGIGGMLMAIVWFSTLFVYRFWCWKSDTTVEIDSWFTICSPLWHLFIRTLIIFPLMIGLFLALSKIWSYIVLVLILIFSALLIFQLPFHFYFNVQRPEFNLEWTYQSILAGCILTVGLIIYYRFISKKVHVFP